MMIKKWESSVSDAVTCPGYMLRHRQHLESFQRKTSKQSSSRSVRFYFSTTLECFTHFDVVFGQIRNTQLTNGPQVSC